MNAPYVPPQWALDNGFRPIPLWKDDYGDIKKPNRDRWQDPTNIFQPHEWKQGEGTGLGCGLEPSGLYLYFADWDHKPHDGIDAPANYELALAKLQPQLRHKLFKAISTKGYGRYVAFRSHRKITSTDIKNAQGQKIGDFLGPGKQVVAPTPDRWLEGTLADIPILDDSEVDEVLTAINYCAPETTDHDSTLDWNEVEHCYGMLDGILKRIGQHTITYKQLHGAGGTDRSATRYGLACELRKRYASPEEEIAAILFHFDFGHLKEKGTKWLKGDIARCISKALARYPDVQTKPSYCRLLWKPGKPLPLPQVEPPRRGRPQVTTGDKVLAWYQANNDAGKVMMRRADVAHALGISVPTLDRYNRHLKAAGLIEIHTVRKGRQTYSYVAILSTIKNTHHAQPEATHVANFDSTQQRTPTPQNANQGTLKKKHTAPDSPAGANLPPAPFRALWHGPDTDEYVTVLGLYGLGPDGRVYCRIAESTTGIPLDEMEPLAAAPAQPPASSAAPSLAAAVRALRLAGAKNRRQLKRMLNEYFPGHAWTPAQIDRCYDTQRQGDRRRQLLDCIASMERAELRRAIRRAERHIARSHEKQDKAWKFWLMYRNRCERELQRKIAADNRERRKAQRSTPAPAVRPRPQPAPAEAASGGVCSTPPQAEHRPHPHCLATLLRLLDDPAWVVEVQRYVEKYPHFDFGVVQARLAALRGAAA